jgi:hypothetical protein
MRACHECFVRFVLFVVKPPIAPGNKKPAALSDAGRSNTPYQFG